ncbi:MAG: hypothetical protein MJ155_00500 [Candidatus Saccharibacteria bacterium]|nr:hypothetical protein [Candidatus Saccharibacteria bacterium]
MYGVPIHSENKIITKDDLIEIFNKINEKVQECRKFYATEKEQNEKLNYSYQNWTMWNYSDHVRWMVDYYDNRQVTYDDFQSFLAVFKNQAYAIKWIHAYCSVSYGIKSEGSSEVEHVNNNITINIREDKFEVESSVSSKDPRMTEVYDFISQKINSAPPKMDRIVKQKELIIMKIGFALGLLPAIIVVFASIFIPQLHGFYNQHFYFFPLLILFLGFIFAIFLGGARTSKSYNKIIPKKYDRYDVNSGKSIYNDDLQTLSSTCDVLIGHKSDIGTERRRIAEDEKRLTKIIPILLGVAAVMTLIAFFITR